MPPSVCFLLLACACATAARPTAPPLDLLASIWQPSQQPTYGALSVTNAWGSLLLSSSNVLGINAVEMAPFSSGWDASKLYGWPTDTATLSLNGVPVPPSATLWTPYSGIRNGTNGEGAQVHSEVRWVFEAQAVLFEVNITLPQGGVVNASVDFLFPLRHYPRADQCDSWHYPTHSEPCCWNWFPPEPAPGQEGLFKPTFEACPGQPGVYDALSQVDDISAAGSAFAIPGACAGSGGGAPPHTQGAPSGAARPQAAPPPTTVLNPGHLPLFRASAPSALVELGAPSSTQGSTATWVTRALAPGETARLRFALAFSNASSPAVNVGAARGLAASFPLAWAQAAEDWQGRFAAVFDQSKGHFSGFLPLLTAGGTGDWQQGFASPMERIYYASIVGLLAHERTNFPPSLPADPGPCPVSRAASPSFNRTAPQGIGSTGSSSGMDRYLPPDLQRLFTGSAFSGGARLRGGFEGGRGASSLLRKARGVAAAPLDSTSLLDEQDAPWRIFITGGGMNTSTNIFLWDNQYGSQLLMLLEPETYARQVLLWMGSVDEVGVPSYLSFWGYDYASRRGVGNYYSSNLFTLMELIHAYLRVTGDVDFLSTRLAIPYPNGTVAHPTLYDLALAMSQHWRSMNASGYLADFGLAPNLLECVPSYIHFVAGPNAGNAWMAQAMSAIAGSWAGDAPTAQALAVDAAAIAQDVLQRLYLPGKGYWRALQPSGVGAPVQHVMDFVYTSRFLGVQGGQSGGRVGPGHIPTHVASEMGTWLKANLLVPHWMRALSLSDPAAPLSNRSDHGPSGSYIGWPALTIKSLHAQGDTAGALAFLNDTLFCATLGPYGQAIEVRPPGDPYKPMDVTLYNAMVSHSFGDAIMEVAFGLTLPLALPGQPPATSPLVDADKSRGFWGTLWGVHWNGTLWNVVSSSGGLALVPA